MDLYIKNAARYVTHNVYKDPEHPSYNAMILAVDRLIWILLLNVCTLVAFYFISASLSIISIFITIASCCWIYHITKVIYRDFRVIGDKDTTTDTADMEFNMVICFAVGKCWNYAVYGTSHIKQYVKTLGY